MRLTPASTRRTYMLISLLGAALTLVVVWKLVPPSIRPPQWQRSSGSPVPSDFLYAMFPKNPAVPLLDGPSGAAIGVLARAVVNSENELNSGGGVMLNEPGHAASVALDQLTLTPPANAQDLFNNFVAVYKSREPNQKFRTASLAETPEPDGAIGITLRLHPDDDHVEEYVYRVAAGVRTPISMNKSFGPADAIADLPRPFLAITAAAAFLILMQIGGFMIRKSRAFC